MTDTKFAILIIHYDPHNDYGRSALRLAVGKLDKAKGMTQLDQNIYLVDCQAAMPKLMALYVEENRFPEDRRYLRFSLVPCGSQVFSELQEVKSAVSASDGLSPWDISVQGPPQTQRG